MWETTRISIQRIWIRMQWEITRIRIQETYREQPVSGHRGYRRHICNRRESVLSYRGDRSNMKLPGHMWIQRIQEEVNNYDTGSEDTRETGNIPNQDI